MTRIEKLEMQGFKSFAKKTVITFPSNFSVIAGPNGSGKSNVLDSICFVLGRTSAKSLRADRMMEMIFHGSKTKPPAE
ncbi:MAG: AAA family ATPase, partial [Candidatus Aenigmatarchaeota archaeon]